jgi:type IX secretion system PorP/SprF family membrane protein
MRKIIFIIAYFGPFLLPSPVFLIKGGLRGISGESPEVRWGGLLFAQQDPQYSQYMFNQLSLNPAYAGSREVFATNLIYRNQWTGIEGAPVTASLTVQRPLRKKKIGIGAEILSDKLGPRNNSAVLFSYSYRIPFVKGKLSFGLRMGIYNYVFDWNKMDYQDKNDVYYTPNIGTRESKITGTGDFGMYYYSRTFYWGMALNHLNQGKISESTFDAKQSIHFFMPIGKAFEVGNTVVNPSLLIKATTNAPAQVDVNINVLLKERLWLGLSARTDYGFVALSQFQINDKLKVGFSLDHGINKIGTVGKRTFEIMLGYDINIHGTKMIMPRYL